MKIDLDGPRSPITTLVDDKGQLGGIGSQNKPVKLMEDPIAIGCGWFSSFILTEQGIMCCGFTNQGVLGLGHQVREWTLNDQIEIHYLNDNKRIKGAHTTETSELEPTH